MTSENMVLGSRQLMSPVKQGTSLTSPLADCTGLMNILADCGGLMSALAEHRRLMSPLAECGGLVDRHQIVEDSWIDTRLYYLMIN